MTDRRSGPRRRYTSLACERRACATAARAWAKRFDDSHDSESLDYLAFEKYIEVVKCLTRRIAFPELPITIEEFAVDQDLGVEVTLGEAVV
jgi:hypothetical protein